MNYDVTYRTSKWHLVAFNLHHMARLWSIRVLVLLLLTYHFGVVVPRYFRMPGTIAAHVLAAAAFTLLAAVVVSGASFLAIWFSISSRTNLGVLTEHHVSLSQDGIVEQTPFNLNRHSWQGVPNIGTSQRFIYIYTQQHGAHVIPKAAFQSPESAQAFLAEATRLWGAARAA